VIILAAHKTEKKTKEATKSAKGDRYVCGECGLVVRVDDVCDCADSCDLVCCETEMTIS
jgi:hypothetical protein